MSRCNVSVSRYSDVPPVEVTPRTSSSGVITRGIPVISRRTWYRVEFREASGREQRVPFFFGTAAASIGWHRWRPRLTSTGPECCNRGLSFPACSLHSGERLIIRALTYTHGTFQPSNCYAGQKHRDLRAVSRFAEIPRIDRYRRRAYIHVFPIVPSTRPLPF